MKLLAAAAILTCVLSPLRAFADAATSVAGSPISIEMCTAEQQSQTNPNLKVGIAFRDLTDSEARKVQFDIQLTDDSGAVIETRTVTIDGKFAPNVLIQPRRAPVTNVLLTQPEYPDSSAWNVPSHFGSNATKVRCELHAAQFADGSVWNRAD